MNNQIYESKVCNLVGCLNPFKVVLLLMVVLCFSLPTYTEQMGANFNKNIDQIDPGLSNPSGMGMCLDDCPNKMNENPE
ncbi:MAG: hypothetical protein AAF694_16995 [Bacteroidota bacterium]